MARWLTNIAAGFLFLIAIISQAGRVSPVADFINNFAPPITAVSALVVATALIVRRRLSWLLVASVLALVSVGSRILLEYAGRPSSAPVENREALKLLAFNIYKNNSSPERVAKWISGQGADIVVLEEVVHLPHGVSDLLEKDYPYSADCSMNGYCSTVIFSKRRPIASGGLAQDDPENRKGVSAVWMRFGDARGEFVVVGVHLQRPPPMGEQTDARLAIAGLVRAIDSPRTIVMGDFNLTPWTFAMRDQDRLFGLTRLSRAMPSWPAPWPIFPIDHVYAGKGWKLAQIVEGPSVGSDHFALKVDLIVAP